jgi:hypothetical protein
MSKNVRIDVSKIINVVCAVLPAISLSFSLVVCFVLNRRVHASLVGLALLVCVRVCVGVGLGVCFFQKRLAVNDISINS